MTDDLTVTIQDDVSPVLASTFDRFEDRLLTVAEAQATVLLDHARDLASGPLLRVRSGAFLAGLSSDVRTTAAGVVASVTAAGPEAPILEFGGRIPAHVIGPNAAKAMRFEGEAGVVFAKVVHDPGGTLKPHPVLETALAGQRDTIVAALADSIEEITT